DLRGLRVAADHRGAPAAGTPVRQQHRCARARRVRVDGDPAGGVLRLPAAVRLRRDGGRGQVAPAARPYGCTPAHTYVNTERPGSPEPGRFAVRVPRMPRPA